MRFAEFTVGQVIETRSRPIDEGEILDFARSYDPQWFHTDAQRAASGRWGGLIASGWHTCAVAMELAVESVLGDSESFGSPGIDELRWLLPVRPGDQLRLKLEVLAIRLSESGGTGSLRWRWTLLNQSGSPVLDLLATSLFDLRRTRP
jgi:acyl dehydratase